MEGDDINLENIADEYLRSIQSLKVHALKVRRKDEAEEKRLLDFLPVNERVEAEKENKVLTRWSERQKEWEKIEQLISKKLNSQVSRPLMMTTTDEYRAKMEEYDLIQASIPIKDRYSESAWQMTLRGGGPIRVAIGHIFSGLECAFDPHVPKPIMVRKPKAMNAVWKNDTFLEANENLAKKRKKYETTMKEIRPHSLTYRDAGQLMIRTRDLFTWAEESSLEYIKAKRLEELRSLEEEEESASASQAERQQMLLDHQQQLAIQHPSLEFLSSPEMVMKTVYGKSVQQMVYFKNNGLTTLYYRWRKLPHGAGNKPPTTAAAAAPNEGGGAGGRGSSNNQQQQQPPGTLNHASSSSSMIAGGGGAAGGAGGRRESNLQKFRNNKNLSRILDEKGDHDASLRTRTLHHHHDSFYCLQETGGILPDEMISTTFLFDCSAGGGGVFHSAWMLELYPEDAHIHIAASSVAAKGEEADELDEEEGADGKKVVGAAKMSIGNMMITLRGYCLVPDESFTRRSQLAQTIEYDATVTSIQDILYECIRRVRSPLRITDIHSRQRNLFAQRNMTLFSSYFQGEKADKVPTWFITDERVQAFAEIHARVHELYVFIQERYENVWKKYQQLIVQGGYATDTKVTMIAADDRTILPEEEKTEMIHVLFPEASLDIFDEVTMEEIVPSWDYRVQSALTTLQSVQVQVKQMAEMEEEMNIVEKKLEKIRLKGEKKAAKRALKFAKYDGKKRTKRVLQQMAEDEAELAEEERDAEAEEAAEEAEPAEEEDEAEKELKKALKPKHPLQVLLDDLFTTTEGSLHFLQLYPSHKPLLSSATRSALVAAMDKIDDCHLEAMHAAGIAEIVTQAQPVPIPPMMNPFTSTEGMHAFDQMMTLTSSEPEPPAGSKPAKASKPAGGKNAVLPTSLTTQQTDYYHKVLYENIRKELLSGLEEMLGMTTYPAIQAEQVKQQQALLQECSAAAQKDNNNSSQAQLLSEHSCILAPEKMMEIATWRTGDVFDQIVCLTIAGDAFLPDPAPYYRSAFSYDSLDRHRTIEQILELAKSQAKAIILLYEGHKGVAKSLKEIQAKDVLLKKWHDYQRKYLKDLKKRKKRLSKPFKQLDILFFPSMPEALYSIDQIIRYGHNGIQVVNSYYDEYIPIMIIDNLALPTMVPIEPAYEEIESDDDTPAISMGKEEAVIKKRSQWENAYPHRVTSNIEVTRGGNNGNNNSKAILKQSCYCDVSKAVEELCVVLASTTTGKMPIWIDDDHHTYYLPSSALAKAQQGFDQTRLVTLAYREALLWASLLPSLPKFQEIIKANDSALVTEEKNVTSYADYLGYLFPHAVQQQRAPRSIFLMGGELRAEKLRMLDEIITLVDTVIITGELAIAFLNASTTTTSGGNGSSSTISSYSFYHHEEMTAKYTLPCRNLIAKARLGGCELLFPIDVILGEDPIKGDAINKVYDQVTPETRSDGIEYEGETKTVALSSLHGKILGRIYDIGPETIKMIASKVQEKDLIYVWGTVGKMEVTSFQQGHTSFIKAITSPPSPDLTVQPARQLVLWGHATVDWFARILDNDADFGGDLMANGYVRYMNRDSSILTGVVGLAKSSVMANCSRFRRPRVNEWIYSHRRLLADDDEEEEEEDEPAGDDDEDEDDDPDLWEEYDQATHLQLKIQKEGIAENVAG